MTPLTYLRQGDLVDYYGVPARVVRVSDCAAELSVPRAPRTFETADGKTVNVTGGMQTIRVSPNSALPLLPEAGKTPAMPRKQAKPSAKTAHGGARKGAGRPLGSGNGRTVVTRSVAMPPAVWAKLDKARKDASRGKFIAGLI